MWELISVVVLVWMLAFCWFNRTWENRYCGKNRFRIFVFTPFMIPLYLFYGVLDICRLKAKDVSYRKKRWIVKCLNWCKPYECTGLKDKNGKFVFEGDVLGGYYGGYVKWCDHCKSFNLFFGDECAACNGDVLWAEVAEDDGKLEVVGNIHQNPELIK